MQVPGSYWAHNETPPHYAKSTSPQSNDIDLSFQKHLPEKAAPPPFTPESLAEMHLPKVKRDREPLE